MTHATITATPISGALGAEVTGVDFSAPLDDATYNAVRQALLDHCVLFFRDQEMTPPQQLAFATRFGDIHVHPHVKGMDDFPEIMEILKTDKDARPFGVGWHTDQMFLAEPALATMLYAKEVPEAGGDTLFTNLYRAYATLSDAMKAMIAGLRTVNLADAGRKITGANPGGGQYGGFNSMTMNKQDDVAAETEHPLVRTHPESGRKALFLGLHTERFANMTTAESQPLLDFLIAHATRPEFTCRFRWREGSVAFWDNRCVLHNAIDDYRGKRRRMHRITLKGDAPV
jgi:taurine dioxygenase